MRHQYNLRMECAGDLAQQNVHLPLSKDLQVRIRFIHQQHTALVRVEICKDEQHLLKAASGRRQSERLLHARLHVIEIDRAAHILFGN